MSFKDMRVKDLREVAEMFGVDVAGLNKQDTLNALELEGVTYEAYEAFANAEKVDPKDEGYVQKPVVQDVGSLLLVKMERQNPAYEVRTPGGTYEFTTRHPFLPINEDDAEFIFDTEDGFRLATPKEVKSFYG
jgi:hypothetical protein